MRCCVLLDEYQFSLLLQKKIKRKCGLPGSVFFFLLSLLLIIAACRKERVNIETKPVVRGEQSFDGASWRGE